MQDTFVEHVMPRCCYEKHAFSQSYR